MSLHHLKLLSEAYRNVSLAATCTATKTDILNDLETMIQKEITDIKYPSIGVVPKAPPSRHMDDEIPF